MIQIQLIPQEKQKYGEQKMSPDRINHPKDLRFHNWTLISKKNVGQSSYRTGGILSKRMPILFDGYSPLMAYSH